MSNDYYTRNKSKVLEKAAKVYSLTREIKLRRVWGNSLKKYWPHLKYTHAIEEYERLFNNQQGLCKICRLPETKVDKQRKKVCRLAVDHCPKTGDVRGLLCFMCNTTLGRFERNFEQIIDYLQEAKVKNIRNRLNLMKR